MSTLFRLKSWRREDMRKGARGKAETCALINSAFIHHARRQYAHWQYAHQKEENI